MTDIRAGCCVASNLRGVYSMLRKNKGPQCVLEGFWYCERSCLANIRTEVCCTFFDRENHQTAYHWNFDTAQHT